MPEANPNYEKWDEIYKFREFIVDENPELKNMKRKKTYVDPEGIIRCTKCGATERIAQCIDCKTEQEYLKP